MMALELITTRLVTLGFYGVCGIHDFQNECQFLFCFVLSLSQGFDFMSPYPHLESSLDKTFNSKLPEVQCHLCVEEII